MTKTPHNRRSLLALFIVALVWIVLWGALFASRAEADGFDYSQYAAVLNQRVNPEGRVDYRGLRDNPKSLEAFMEQMKNLSLSEYRGWPDRHKIAFWINAYNALTLKAIIDHYPIRAGGLSAWMYPDESIRQIDGVWDRLKFTVLGERMSLGHIEHEILRKEFDEPRIHVALVCAALGCPKLRDEPYTGERLDAQLREQGLFYMRDTRHGLRVDREKKVVYLSKIFKWFDEDFVPRYLPKQGFDKFSQSRAAVLNYAARHAPEPWKDYLLKGDYDLRFIDYDWSLNKQ